MLRLLLTSLLFTLLGTCVRAQTLPITYRKQFIGYSFQYDNLRLQMPNFRRAMHKDPEARAVMYGAGATEFAGVLLVTYGTATVVSVALLEGYEDNAFSGKSRVWVAAGGLAGVVLGSWLVHLADKKRVRAVDVYNKNLKMPTTYRPSVRAGVTGDGIGIGVRF